MWIGANICYSQKVWGRWEPACKLLTLTQQTVCKATASSAITRALAQLGPPPCAPKSAGSRSLCGREGMCHLHHPSPTLEI